MAFGFANKGRTNGGVLAATQSKKKAVPKSVQAIIDKAGANAWAAANNYAAPAYQPGQSGMAVNNPVPKITPPNQTGSYGAGAMTGAGMVVGPGSTSDTGVNGRPAIAGPSAFSNDPGSLPKDGTNAYSGWMSQFTPAAFQDQIWNDPQTVLNAMWQEQGLNQGSPLYSTLRSLNGADPMSLDLLMNPGQTAAQMGDAQAYGNFLHSLYGNQMTAGGRTPNFAEMMANLAGVGDQSKTDPTGQSALYQQLVQGGAPQQFRTYYGLAQDAAKMGLAPSIASAFLDSLARQGDQYLTSSAQGNTTPYFQYATNPMVR